MAAEGGRRRRPGGRGGRRGASGLGRVDAGGGEELAVLGEPHAARRDLEVEVLRAASGATAARGWRRVRVAERAQDRAVEAPSLGFIMQSSACRS